MNTTPDLFDWKAKAPRDTRRAAYRASRKWANGLQSLCWAKLAAIGPATADEVAAALGKSILAVRPRFTELYEAGEIRDTGQRRPSRGGYGRPQKVWST